MNLITDAWIPVLRQDGPAFIAPWQIAERDNPVLEINAPRPDFQGALYQFMIGLLQTCFAPEDEDEWLEFWQEPPGPEELQEAFAKVEAAFELFNPDGPAFMQDFNLPDGSEKGIAALLIDAPGENTIKYNIDHFVKRDQVRTLCPTCAASAIFTLQINAPAGGAGNRVGLRGGGPLTTLLVPENTDADLWQKLWLNVLNREEIPTPEPIDEKVLPWLAETRVSPGKADITTPEDVHVLQAYWGMPRRIRIEEARGEGECHICGAWSPVIFEHYRTKKHGVNYDGAWVHPLTPYLFDKEKKTPPIPIKGDRGKNGYRYWIGLSLQDDEQEKAAKIIRFFNEERGRLISESSRFASLWCFGYEMDKQRPMKARCWYDSHFPFFVLSREQRENLVAWAGEMVRAAEEVVRILREAVKAAWFKRPKDVKGDMSKIDRQFWEETESDFYRLLDELARIPGDIRMAPPEIYESWFKSLERSVMRIFARNCFESVPEDLDMKRIIQARKVLMKKFYGNKEIKSLKAKSTKEEAA